MAQDGSIVRRIRAPGVVASPMFGKLYADQLSNSPNFVPTFIFDLPSQGGWPSNANPVNGDPVPDLSGLQVDGSVLGSSAVYTGGGFDLSACNTANSGAVQLPAASLNAIHDAADEWFMMCLYAVIPSSADWPTSAADGMLFDGGNTSTIPALGQLTMYNPANRAFRFNRQRGASPGTIDASIVTVNAAAHDTLCQIFFAYGSGYQRVAYRSMAVSDGTLQTSSNTADGGVNSQDFSTVQAEFGVGATWSGTAGELAANNMSIHRGWVGYGVGASFDPAAVALADWNRVQARIAADIVANGMQTIFL